MDIQKTYSIGETAEITGISQRQLRNWEGRYIPNPLRITVGERSFRRYTADDIRLLKKIKEHLENGFTLFASAKNTAEFIKVQKEV